MKCVIPGANIKVFGRAIHSLSKIGEELYIEPLDHGLALRTVNSSRSAYACFLFAPSFFHHYDDGAGDVNTQDSDDTLRCKIAMKSILTVFKSLSTMEKTVDTCKINLKMRESRLVFTLNCRHGIVKTHNLAFIECETLQAVFSKDMSPNSLTATAKLLCDAVLNFQNNQEEITLIVNPEKIILKNYVDDEPDPNKVMHTNLTLDPDEFDNYQVGVDTEVTFCLKELRAILAFSEVTTLPLTLQFESAGKPMVFSIDSDSTFEANFVLATLADQQSQSQAPMTSRPHTQQKRTSVKTASRPTHSTSHYKPKASTSVSSNTVPKPVQQNGETRVTKENRADHDIERSQRLEAAYDELMNDENDFEEMLIENDTTINIAANKRSIDSRPSTSRAGGCSDGPSTSRAGSSVDKPSTSRAGSSNNGPSTSRAGSFHKEASLSRASSSDIASKNDRKSISKRTVTELGDSSHLLSERVESSVPGSSKEASPVLPMLGTKTLRNPSPTEDVADVAWDNEELDDDYMIPATPPAKRFKLMFFGTQSDTQSQAQKDSTVSKSRVLAEDTDDED